MFPALPASPALAPPPTGQPDVPNGGPDRDDALRDAAVRLEAAFLAEMLKSAGLGETGEAFGGGAGEQQFSSFLVDQQALQMARAGGIGLAEMLFESLKESESDDR